MVIQPKQLQSGLWFRRHDRYSGRENSERVVAGGSALEIPGGFLLPSVLTICFKKYLEQDL